MPYCTRLLMILIAVLTFNYLSMRLGLVFYEASEDVVNTNASWEGSKNKGYSFTVLDLCEDKIVLSS